MRNFVIAVIAGAMLLVSFLPASAQVTEPRGPRPEIVYGEETHYVTLTFYIGQDDAMRLEDILDVLQEGNVSNAVFFMDPGFVEGNSSLVNTTEQSGYTVLPWSDAGQYDPDYSPTEFAGILLSDREVLGRTDKVADYMAFYNLALHSANASVVAFTPSAPPDFNASTTLLEEILGNGGRTLVFTDDESAVSQPAAMAVGREESVVTTSVGANTTNSIEVESGDWGMQDLLESYPSEVSIIQTDFGPSYLVNTTLIVGEDARLNISGENVLIASPEQDLDRRIEVLGAASIANSLVSSWDLMENAQDANPYHQRPFIFVDGGQIEIRNSTISHLGFPLAGLSEERSARAAIMFHESGNFTIADSTIAFNFDSIYARNSTNFQITGNEIYANTRSGIDIRSGSNNFVISENHVHDNGYEGVICTECTGGVHIVDNAVEYSKEAGIKLFTGTNSTVVDGNTVSYNENFGIYLRNNSTGNTISNNTVTGSEEGITLSGSSNNNTIAGNILVGNDVAIESDPTSQSNVLQNNRTNATQAG